MDTTTTVEQPTRRKAARPTRAEERPPGEQPEAPDTEEQPEEPPPAAPEKEDTAPPETAAAERARIQAITRSVRAANLGEAFADQLIDSGTPADKVDRAVVAELARRQPAVSRSVIDVVTPPSSKRQREGIVHALLLRSAPDRYPTFVKDLEPARRAELADAAREWQGLTLMELARACLEARGVRTRGLDKMQLAAVALGLAHPSQTREGPHGFLATADLPMLLATVGHATLTAGYQMAPRTFPPWTRQATLPDFRITTRVSLGLGPQLLQVPEHAEYTRGKLSLQGQPVQLATWGRILAFTRQALINDDVSLFTRIPQLFGNAAAAVEGNSVYNLLTSNPTMADGNALFSAAHGNLMAAATINISSVAAARSAMMNQKSADGQFMAITPAFLICGPAQEVYAYQFMTPITIVGSISNVVPDQMRAMQVIVDPRITDNAWYLAASPNQVDTIEYNYLAGAAQGPSLETREGWDIDGQEYKARLEFGAAVIDWRGLVKNPGLLPAGTLQAPAGDQSTSGGGTEPSA